MHDQTGDQTGDQAARKVVMEAYERWKSMPQIYRAIGRRLQEAVCDDAELYALTEARWKPVKGLPGRAVPRRIAGETRRARPSPWAWGRPFACPGAGRNPPTRTVCTGYTIADARTLARTRHMGVALFLHIRTIVGYHVGMMRSYEDWTPEDWTIGSLAGEIRDQGYDSDQVEIRTEGGLPARIIGMYRVDDRRVQIVIEPGIEP